MEDLIAKLVHQFNDAPSQFFHEEELHAVFFGLCRGNFPLVRTQNNHEVHLFRHEYDTIWRYARRDPKPYTERLTDRGVTACFDFALLSRDFVQEHELLTVINKDEVRRQGLRQTPWTQQGTSAVIDVGIEFKMAHRRHQMDIAQGQVNALRAGMLLDARKLATERVGVGYLLAFSHGPRPDPHDAPAILQAVAGEHRLRRNDIHAVQLRVLLATPQHTFLNGGWANAVDFPRYVQV